MDALLEEIDNLKLLENNYRHIEFELGSTDPSLFRIARETHHGLYRAMVQALRGTANIAITGKPKDKTRTARYTRDRAPWVEIHRVPVPGCRKAWRYSEPSPCTPPEMLPSRSQPTQVEDYLLGFYDLLAMIQRECFMGHYMMSKPVPVTDSEMQTLEWVHEDIRNEYEHFVPKTYLAPRDDLRRASLICVDLTLRLLRDSGNVFGSDLPQGILQLIERCHSKLTEPEF